MTKKTKGRLVSQTFEETQCKAPLECAWPECQCPRRGVRPRALKTSVVVKHRVPITHKPIAGCATYRAGKLVFIISGSYKTHFFNWATIKPDGTLGRINIRGYWS